MGFNFTRRKVAALAVGAVGAAAVLGGVSMTSASAATHVENPFVGQGYVNADWAAQATADGGAAIADQPTGVWMDKIAAITGTATAKGLAAHLDDALAQGADYINLVIYNLPGRDCAALASQGELGATEIGRYQTEYINPIAAILADPAYDALNIVTVIEIDSLPNLVTNVGSRVTATAACDTMLANGNYVTGIQYALDALHAIPNVHTYIDAGHHGWLGWESNFLPAAQLFAQTAQGTADGFNSVDGFIVNTANYGATTEPYLTLTAENRLSKWIDYNNYVDEQSFAVAFRTALIGLGFNSSIGMLIDTSRNGWGGADRPTAAVTTGTVDEQVDGSRIDRRIHLGNWCNQAGAGIGARPVASPAAGIDAYVWIKPPGESDGSGSVAAEGKGIDGMCDPAYAGNPRNNNNMSGALPDAPISGAWFSAQFQELIANAYPAL